MTPRLDKHSRSGFWALIVTQFQGAFNDNLFKFLVIFFLVDLFAGQLGPGGQEAATQQMVAIATIVFALPFIIFPGLFGGLSDRYSKKTITVWSKYIEIAVMVLGAVAFFIGTSWGLWVLLFCMATQSAFFSPSKYGILPEILTESRLSWGNGVLSLGTILAVIAGVGVAGPLYDRLGSRTYVAGILLAMLSMLGTAASYGISKPPAADPARKISINPWAGMGQYFSFIYRDRILLMSMIGYCYFWFAGAFLQGNLLTYSKITLALSNTQNSILQACLAAGIGIGSLAAGYMSRGKIELGLVPLGMLGMTVTTALLSVPDFSFSTVVVILVFMGAFGGMFNVPLSAMVQYRAPAIAKGGAMATANVLTFLAMLIAGALLWGLSFIGVKARPIFLMTGLLTLAVNLYLIWGLRYFLVRTFIWAVGNAFYRIRTVGAEQIPPTGGALLISNHLSFADPGILAFAIDRPLSFLMYRAYYDKWWMWLVKQFVNLIPIAAEDSPAELAASLTKAGEALDRGELVCVFAEGGISRTGELLSFQKGYQRINRNAQAPVIPCHIDNMWGSVFSYSEGRFFFKWPSFLRRVTVRVGALMPPNTTPSALRNAVQDLGTESLLERRLPHKLIHRAFISYARRHPRQLCIADTRSGPLSRFRTLAGSIILAKKLRKLLDNQPMVGLLLPPSVGGALANISLQIMGKTPVNLNYTANNTTIASCARQCGITQCITAKAFLDRLPVEVPGEPILLENVMKSIRPVDRITGMLWALFAPQRLIEWRVGSPWRRPEHDLACIIFSSGSEGEPKGAMLTQRNVLGNVTQFIQVFPHKRNDTMMAFLPFFHSFGFTATLWAPLICGVNSVFHPSPLEAKAIGQLIRKYKAKFLIATPTFLQSFIRRCGREEMQSLEFVVCGAEKLTARIRDAFREKFGVEPLEGYGTTECSPVVSVCIPDFKARGINQRGNKRGSIGRPLPGISVRTVNPDSGEVLQHGEPGLLQIRGINTMKGYLNAPEKTAKVLQDGWYSTGDIASIDEDGFIFITDRLARFSKIVGEMVPHGKVEEVLHELLEAPEQVLAVTGVPDQARGERLVVLHTLPNGQLEELIDRLDKTDLPNLWKPRLNAFYRVDAIPVLGTGKTDLKAVKALAAKLDLGE